jgi:hypothetical protein
MLALLIVFPNVRAPDERFVCLRDFCLGGAIGLYGFGRILLMASMIPAMFMLLIPTCCHDGACIAGIMRWIAIAGMVAMIPWMEASASGVIVLVGKNVLMFLSMLFVRLAGWARPKKSFDFPRLRKAIPLPLAWLRAVRQDIDEYYERNASYHERIAMMEHDQTDKQ